jgi:hypothetical protein
VARLRLRRLMRPHPAVRIARVAVPAAPVTGPRGSVAGRPMRGNEAQAAYPAASTTSAKSTNSVIRVRGQEASRHAARAAIRDNVATRQPMSSASKTVRPILKLNVIGSGCTTTDLNVRTEARRGFSVGGVVHARAKPSVTATITNGFQCLSYQRWVKSQYLSSEPSTSTISSGGRRIPCAPCRSRSLVDSGVTPEAIRIDRAVCHRYPQFTTVHGLRALRGYRGEGRALDCLISDSTGRLEHRELDPRQRQEIRPQRGHLSAPHLDCAAELGRLASGCQTRVHRLPIAWNTWTSPSTATAQHAS